MVKLSSGIELNPNELTSEDREAIVKALEETKNGVWKPKNGEKHWWISVNGDVNSSPFTGEDMGAVEVGNVFPTREACEEHVRYLKALQVLRGDTKGYEYNYKDDGKYWTIGVFGRGMEPGYYSETLDVIKFGTQEDAQASLDAHRDSWAAVLGVE